MYQFWCCTNLLHWCLSFNYFLTIFYYLISCHYSPKVTKLHTSLLSNSFTCLFYLSQQEFHVAYVLIKMGNSPRPAVWALEKSKDNGKTYHPWQYFSDSTTWVKIHLIFSFRFVDLFLKEFDWHFICKFNVLRYLTWLRETTKCILWSAFHPGCQ